MSNGPSKRVGRRAVWAVATAALCLPCIANLRAEEEASAQEPLAQCELQTIAGGQSPASAMDPLPSVFQDRSAQPMDNYQRGFGSEWQVPAEVDPADPNVRLMLLAPAGPVILDVAVYINGQPFRAIRERWIDGVLRGDDVAAIMAAQSEGETAENEATQRDAEKATEEVAQEPPEEEDDSPAASDNEPEEDSDASNESQSEQSSDEEDSKQQNEKEDEKPAQVEAKRYEAPGPLMRLKSYVRALDGPLERGEARWLLAEWVPGPAELELRHGFAWERAGLAPLVELWDENHDGTLSSAEIASARQRLQACDVNEDDTVELLEITRKLGKQVSLGRGWTPPRLIAVLDEETDWSALARDLARTYSRRGPSGLSNPPAMERLASRLGVESSDALTPGDLARLVTIPADVSVQVSFGQSDTMSPGVAVMRIDPEMGDAKELLGSTKEAIVFELAGAYVEFSAAAGEDQSGQISCGAVVDGYPLMRHLDSDNDRRFSIREMQQVADSLGQFDRDGDDQIDAAELRTPIRLAFAQGPHVHSMLAEPTGAAIRERLRPKQEAPIWFMPMDANGDGDVTRAEFFGTDDQFKILDADGDGLVSAAEAIAAESASGPDEEDRIENGGKVEDSTASSETPAEE